MEMPSASGLPSGGFSVDPGTYVAPSIPYVMPPTSGPGSGDTGSGGGSSGGDTGSGGSTGGDTSGNGGGGGATGWDWGWGGWAGGDGGYGYGGGGYGFGDGGGGGGTSATGPITLDLSGKGIKITQLSSSSTFFDMTGDGYKNQTAWAGVGNGVLFVDSPARAC